MRNRPRNENVCDVIPEVGVVAPTSGRRQNLRTSEEQFQLKFPVPSWSTIILTGSCSLLFEIAIVHKKSKIEYVENYDLSHIRLFRGP
jgi:hypothetical protein